jgi:hypothetical protein
MANKKIYQFPIDANLSGDNLFLMWADDITAVSTLSGVTNYISNNILIEDIYVTGGTYNGTDIILTRNDNNTISFPLVIPDNGQNQWIINSANTVTVKTNSQSFIYGDLIVEGLLILEVNSKLVVLNGDIILNGGSIIGDGITQLVEIPTNIWGAGSTGSYSVRTLNNSIVDATGDYAVAEGYSTAAVGNYSHAGGSGSTANGEASFVHSVTSTVTGNRSAVIGGSGIIGSEDDTLYTPRLETVLAGEGIIMLSPDGTRYKVTITNAGAISIVLV